MILKPNVLSRIEVACCRDFQNGASKENGYDIKTIFRNLSNVESTNKEEVLLELLKARPLKTWTEARIFDFLRESDVEEDRYRREMMNDLLMGEGL